MSAPAARPTSTARSPLRLLAPLAYLIVLVGSAFTAYWAMFSGFLPYDDSGLLIHSYRLFMQGEALYDQVWTAYGPFSYELWGAVFGLIGHTVSTDSGRLAVIGIWLFTSLLLGVSAQRLTGRLTIGVIVQVLSFNVLTVLIHEPMHPSAVACALFAVAVAILTFVLPSRPRGALIALGALVAALLLTKINVGGFAGIAVAWATVMTLPALRRIAALRWLTTAALVAVGPLLMSKDLTQQWAEKYALLVVAGSLALVIATDGPQQSGPGDADEARRWVGWLLAGFLACTVVVIGIVFALGTTPGALYHDIIIVPTHQSKTFTVVTNLADVPVFLAVCGVIVAAVVRRRRSESTTAQPPGLVGALGRLFAALVIWLTVGSAPYYDFSLALTVAWVAAIPSSRDDGSLHGRFVRLLIPALAILQSLVAYPVAGSQVQFGSLLFLLCGAVCFADAWSDLEVWSVARDSRMIGRAGTIMLSFASVLAVISVSHYVVAPLKVDRKVYDANVRLPIAGASRLRLPREQASRFIAITTLLRSRCRTVITMPGMLSFNLWSGLPAPSGLTAEPFWHLLSPTEERTALSRARTAAGLCAVRNDRLARFWDDGKPTPQVPLVRFIEHDFTPIGSYGDYTVSVRSAQMQSAAPSAPKSVKLGG